MIKQTLKPAPRVTDEDSDRIKNMHQGMVIMFCICLFTLIWVLGVQTELKLQSYRLMDVRDDTYQTKIFVKEVLRHLADTNQTKNGA
jgi:hypothetical protein